jgi:hypothetical protein
MTCELSRSNVSQASCAWRVPAAAISRSMSSSPCALVSSAVLASLIVRSSSASSCDFSWAASACAVDEEPSAFCDQVCELLSESECAKPYELIEECDHELCLRRVLLRLRHGCRLDFVGELGDRAPVCLYVVAGHACDRAIPFRHEALERVRVLAQLCSSQKRVISSVRPYCPVARPPR